MKNMFCNDLIIKMRYYKIQNTCNFYYPYSVTAFRRANYLLNMRTIFVFKFTFCAKKYFSFIFSLSMENNEVEDYFCWWYHIQVSG